MHFCIREVSLSTFQKLSLRPGGRHPGIWNGWGLLACGTTLRVFQYDTGARMPYVWGHREALWPGAHVQGPAERGHREKHWMSLSEGRKPVICSTSQDIEAGSYPAVAKHATLLKKSLVSVYSNLNRRKLNMTLMYFCFILYLLILLKFLEGMGLKTQEVLVFSAWKILTHRQEHTCFPLMKHRCSKNNVVWEKPSKILLRQPVHCIGFTVFFLLVRGKLLTELVLNQKLNTLPPS